MDSFYSEEELTAKEFKSIGSNVKISRFASIYGQSDISIGNNVRIDDFCILSGKITLGNNIHIAAGCYLFGGEAGIEMEDFSGLSSRVVVYAVSDDYSGAALTNPTVPLNLRNIIHGKVILNKHVIVGTSTVILPGVVIGEGSAVGALSLVTKSLPALKICVGIPAKPVSDRKDDLFRLESEYSNLYNRQL